jgi:hypothetical protein
MVGLGRGRLDDAVEFGCGSQLVARTGLFEIQIQSTSADPIEQGRGRLFRQQLLPPATFGPSRFWVTFSALKTDLGPVSSFRSNRSRNADSGTKMPAGALAIATMETSHGSAGRAGPRAFTILSGALYPRKLLLCSNKHGASRKFVTLIGLHNPAARWPQ